MRCGSTTSTTSCTCCSPASGARSTRRSARSTGSCASCDGPTRSASSSARRTTTRSATARSATGCRPTRIAWRLRACSSRSTRRSSSWARSTRSAIRSSSSPTTSTRRLPTGRAKDGGVTSCGRRGHPGRSRTRRTRRRSCARSSRRASPSRSSVSCSRCARHFRASSDVDADGERVTHAARARDAHARLPRQDGGAARMTPRVWPGKPFPLGPVWDGEGTNFSALLRERRARRALPVRRRRQRGAARAARADLVQLARLPPGRRPRPALRLPRARAVGARAGAPLQPAQAPARPYAKAIDGPIDWDAGNTLPYPPNGGADVDLQLDEEDDARAMPKCVVIDETSTGRTTS